MAIELTISTEYCPDWGLWEGIRETIQNAKDGEGMGHRMCITHSGDTLTVENEGVHLDSSVWLLGQTSKVGSNVQRGQFGEGLKLGVLALTRAGHPVKIINDDSRWHPCIRESKQFPGTKVLVIDTHKCRPENKFAVTIDGVSASDWAECSLKFAFMHKDLGIKVGKDTIITDPVFAGKIFAKGIYVMTDDKIKLGYDLWDIKVDRDRMTAYQYELLSGVAKALVRAAEEDQTFTEECVYPMLVAGSKDIENFYYCCGDELSEIIASIFKSKHGENAFPVCDSGEAFVVERMGKVVVYTNLVFQQVLCQTLGTIEAMQNKFSHSYTPVPDGNLNHEEKSNLMDACFMVDNALRYCGESVSNRLTVAEFVCDNICGLWQGGQIIVAKSQLTDMSKLIGTLVHEVAHGYGGDGSASHIEKQTEFMGKIIEMLWQMK